MRMGTSASCVWGWDATGGTLFVAAAPCSFPQTLIARAEGGGMSSSAVFSPGLALAKKRKV